jgi:hypothetical protein
MAILASAIFIISIFALVTAILGDPQASMAQFFNQYAGNVFACEVGVILLVSWIGLTIDRRDHARRKWQEARDRVQSKSCDQNEVSVGPSAEDKSTNEEPSLHDRQNQE